jgi:hypothetical protein
MRRSLQLSALLLVALSAVGCRYKGWESFTSATNKVSGGPAPVPGDPYGFGGIGLANGGLIAKTNYGAGADENSPGKVNDAFDQPEKGSGQRPGELPNVAKPGHGDSNSPANQASPADTTDTAVLAHG